MQATDTDYGNGELVIKLPTETYGIVAGRCFRMFENTHR